MALLPIGKALRQAALLASVESDHFHRALVEFKSMSDSLHLQPTIDTFNILLNNDVVPCIFNALERNRTFGRWLSSKCRRTRILICANITGAVCRGSNE